MGRVSEQYYATVVPSIDGPPVDDVGAENAFGRRGLDDRANRRVPSSETGQQFAPNVMVPPAGRRIRHRKPANLAVGRVLFVGTRRTTSIMVVRDQSTMMLS